MDRLLGSEKGDSVLGTSGHLIEKKITREIKKRTQEMEEHLWDLEVWFKADKP